MVLAMTKHADNDFNYDLGVWQTAERALSLLKSMYFIMCILMTLALGKEWIEGVKISAMCFLFFASYSFYLISKSTKSVLLVPAFIFLSGGFTVAWYLKSVQELVYGTEG